MTKWPVFLTTRLRFNVFHTAHFRRLSRITVSAVFKSTPRASRADDFTKEYGPPAAPSCIRAELDRPPAAGREVSLRADYVPSAVTRARVALQNKMRAHNYASRSCTCLWRCKRRARYGPFKSVWLVVLFSQNNLRALFVFASNKRLRVLEGDAVFFKI